MGDVVPLFPEPEPASEVAKRELFIWIECVSTDPSLFRLKASSNGAEANGIPFDFDCPVPIFSVLFSAVMAVPPQESERDLKKALSGIFSQFGIQYNY